MKIENAINIDDLRRLARRRLPRMVFDFIEGGVEDEHCLGSAIVTRVPSASRRPASRHWPAPEPT